MILEKIEITDEQSEADEESKRNHEIYLLILVAIELALENPKNVQRLQEIWKENDPIYKKWLEG